MNFQDIENEKNKIRKSVAKGIVPDKDKAFSHIEEDELRSFLVQWYQAALNLKFVGDLDFEEKIFHSSSHIQSNFKDLRTFDGEDCTQEDFQLALDLLCLIRGVTWNKSSPFASFDINLRGDSFRASLLHQSLCAEHGAKLFLRSKSNSPFALDSFTEDTEFLEGLISKRKNVLVCGGTGSGKTSLLNSLLEKTDSNDHLVVLEDTFEILSPTENTTRLLARQNEPDDLKNFMAHAMRMSPDRIVLGELRSAEAEPFLLAMNSGHRGLLSTIHANGASDAISRLALLVRLYAKNSLDYDLVCKLICQNVDYVVYMRNKKVIEVIEVFGSEGGQVFYETVATTLKEAV